MGSKQSLFTPHGKSDEQWVQSVQYLDLSLERDAAP